MKNFCRAALLFFYFFSAINMAFASAGSKNYLGMDGVCPTNSLSYQAIEHIANHDPKTCCEGAIVGGNIAGLACYELMGCPLGLVGRIADTGVFAVSAGSYGSCCGVRAECGASGGRNPDQEFLKRAPCTAVFTGVLGWMGFLLAWPCGAAVGCTCERMGCCKTSRSHTVKPVQSH